MKSLFAAVLLFYSCSFLLQAQPTASTWNGSVSSDWFDAANWTPTELPGSNTNITIPDSTTVTHVPKIAVDAALGRSIDMRARAALHIQSGSLVLTQNLIIRNDAQLHQMDGDFKLVNANVLNRARLVLFAGNISLSTLTLSAGSRLAQNGGEIRLNRNLISGPGCLQATGGKAVFDSDAFQQRISGNPTFWDLEIANTSGDTVGVFLESSITINNDLFLNNGYFSAGFGNSAFSITLAGDWFSNGGFFNPINGQVIFVGTGNNLITGTNTEPIKFGDLLLNKVSGLAALTSNLPLVISGSLEIQRGELVVNSVPSSQFEIAIGLDLIISQSGGIFLNNIPTNATTVRISIGRNLFDFNTFAAFRTGAVDSRNGLKFTNAMAEIVFNGTDPNAVQVVQGFARVQARVNSNSLNRGLLMPKVVVNTASSVLLENDGVRILDNIDILSGIFNLNGRALIHGTTSLTRTITVYAGGTLNCNAGSRLFVGGTLTTDGVGGTIRLVGSGSDNPVYLNRDGNAPFTRVIVNAGGTLAARHYVMSLIASQGVEMNEGSLLDPVNNLSFGTFYEAQAASVIHFLQLRNSLPDGTTITNIKFNYSNTSSINVFRPNTVTGTVIFKNCSGNRVGPNFENDPADPNNNLSTGRPIPDFGGLVHWDTDAQNFTWTGAENTQWYNSNNWAQGSVPTAIDNVLIPTVGTNRYPILEANVTINSIEITANPTNPAALIFNTNGRHLTATGEIRKIGNNGVFRLANGSVLNIEADFIFPNATRFVADLNTLTRFTGATTLLLPFTFGNLEVAGTLFINTNSSGFTCHDFKLSSGLLSFTSITTFMNVEGSWECTNGVFANLGGRVVFRPVDNNIRTILSGGQSFSVVHFLPNNNVFCTYKLLDDMTANSTGISSGAGGASIFMNSNNPAQSVTFDVNGKTLFANEILLRSQAAADGSHLLLSPGSTLALGPNFGIRLTGNRPSRVSFMGDSLNRVKVTNQDGGTYAIALNAACNVSAQFADFEFMDPEGVNISAATIHTVFNFSNCSFSNLTAAPGTLLQLPNQALNPIRNVRFYVAGSPEVGVHYNVRRTAVGNGPTVFLDAVGNLSGEQYERDSAGPNNPGNIHWNGTPGLYVYWGNFKFGNWNDAPSKWRDVHGNIVPLPTSSQIVVLDHRFCPTDYQINITNNGISIAGLVMNGGNIPIVLNMGNRPLTILGDFDMYTNRDTLYHGNSTLRCAGSWSSFAGNYITTNANATVLFDGSVGTMAIRFSNGVNRMIINSPNRVLRLITPLVVNNGLTIENGVLDVDENQSIFIAGGDFIINQGELIPRTGTVSFTGSADQSISFANSEQRFFNLELLKPSGQVNLQSNIRVRGALVFRRANRARLITDAHTCRMGSSASVTGVNPDGSNGYVDGKLSFVYSSNSTTQNRKFQIGKGETFLPFTLGLRLVNPNPTEVVGELFNSAPSVMDLPNTPEVVDKITSAHHYKIVDLGNSDIQNAVITISYNGDDVNSMPGARPESLRLLKSNATKTAWMNLSPESGATGNFLSGTITSTINWTSFSEFAVGDADIIILPVEGLELSAAFKAEQQGVALNWVTQREQSNAGFAIERSTAPLLGFDELDSYYQNPMLLGMGTTNTPSQYQWFDDQANQPGTTYYYRLRQIDFDGKSRYSPAVAVSVPHGGNLSQLRVYPNPVSDQATFALSLGRDSYCTLQVFDLQGRVVHTIHQGNLNAGNHQLNWRTEGLAPGIYTWRLTTDSDVQTGKLMINAR